MEQDSGKIILVITDANKSGLRLVFGNFLDMIKVIKGENLSQENLEDYQFVVVIDELDLVSELKKRKKYNEEIYRFTIIFLSKSSPDLGRARSNGAPVVFHTSQMGGIIKYFDNNLYY